VSLYAGVFVLVNATYILLCWEVCNRHNIGEPPRVLKIMYIRSLLTLGLFATAALVALKYPVGGMALIWLCLVLYIQPEAPRAIGLTSSRRQPLLRVTPFK
jgi:hypothetical protein